MPRNLIGYLAHNNGDPLCDGDSCVIIGSRGRMKRVARQMTGEPAMVIQAADFASIADGLRQGGAYSFDEKSYRRFLGPAQAAGFPLEEEDFSDARPGGTHFVRVQCFGTGSATG
jgi:hypothetical protein